MLQLPLLPYHWVLAQSLKPTRNLLSKALLISLHQLKYFGEIPSEWHKAVWCNKGTTAKHSTVQGKSIK